jgi:hypothetical protein
VCESHILGAIVHELAAAVRVEHPPEHEKQRLHDFVIEA